MRDFIPGAQDQLLSFTTNLAQKLIATPTIYGATAAQADDYDGLNASFASALALVQDPVTRSPVNYESKRMKKKALISATRELVRILQSSPEMDDEKRRALGLTVPVPGRTRVPRPNRSPVLTVVAVEGARVKLRLRDPNDPDRRRRPAGVKGATVLSYVGDSFPVNTEDWAIQGNLSTMQTTLTMPATLPAGTKVWFTAFWFNAKMESGPAANPVSAFLGGGGIATVAA